MKINSTLETQLQTNVKATSHDFGIGDPAMVIEILRKRLYSNPIQTLVQEYISNARDACRESGMPEKITVTIPTPNNKVFRVRDYGCGISPDRMANVFVNYCSSTKRADNTQTGGFGIGAKSAWAYTDNFQVISYYDGIAYHYSAHLGKKNSGTLDLISEMPTSEPNGCEIQVAVAQYDLESFANAVYRCTVFWDNRPELRGISSVQLPDWYKSSVPALKVGNVSFYKHASHQHGIFRYNTDVLVIDGIPYPIPYDINEVKHAKDYCCAVSIPTGIVEVSANRETLSDHAENRQAMQNVFNEATTTIETHLKTELSKAKNLKEFVKVYGKYSEIVEAGIQDYTKVPDWSVSIQDGEFHGQAIQLLESVKLGLEKVRNSDDKYRIEAEDKAWKNWHRYTLFYVDKDVGKSVVYSKVRQYLLSLPSDQNRQGIVLSSTMDKANLELFAKELQAIPLSSIELERKVPTITKPKDQIILTTFVDVSRYGRSGRGHEGMPIELSTNTKRFVYEVKETESTDFTGQKSALKGLARFLKEQCDIDFGFVSASTEKKIAKDPNFITVTKFWENPCEYLNDKGNEFFKGQILNEASANINNRIRSLAADKEFVKRQTKIKDSDLNEAIKVLQTKTQDVHYYRNESETVCKQVLALFTVQYPEYKNTADAFKLKMQAFDKYPMLSYLYSSFEIGYNKADYEAYEDLILYLNTKYEATKK